jgi:hypothetical protein
LTFIIGKDDGPDSYYYATLFARYTQSDLGIRELWSSFYSESSNFVDIASPLITFLVSRISRNPQMLFTVFGLIFGYFYSRNIWYVLDRINGKITAIALLFIMTFILVNPIWNICNFRYWAAAQIFLFGTLPYLIEGNRKRLIWAGVSVLFHFSFLFSLGIFLVFFFLKNRTSLYLVFFLLTSFIKELNLQSVQYLFSFLPGVFQSRVSGYTNLDYAETLSNLWQSNNWYLVLSSQVIRWGVYIIVLFIYIRGRKLLKNRNDLLTLFSYSLLLYGCSNVFSLVPSGSRFLMVSNSFMFAFIILFTTSYLEIRGLNLILALSAPLLLLFCIVTIRTGMDFYGLLTVFGNPFLRFFNSDADPLIEGVKKLISG